MQIVLPPEVEALVQRQITSGKYQNAIAVILAGIKLLEQQEDIFEPHTTKSGVIPVSTISA
jgi:antitoxin ParD1/3/4